MKWPTRLKSLIADGAGIWHYQSPTSPIAAKIEIAYGGLEYGDRWMGFAACSECDLKWVADISDSDLERLPLACPRCRSMSGWPEPTWREAEAPCLACGEVSTIAIVDPSEDWPNDYSCPRCESHTAIPVPGSSQRH